MNNDVIYDYDYRVCKCNRCGKQQVWLEWISLVDFFLFVDNFLKLHPDNCITLEESKPKIEHKPHRAVNDDLAG